MGKRRAAKTETEIRRRPLQHRDRWRYNAKREEEARPDIEPICTGCGEAETDCACEDGASNDYAGRRRDRDSM